MVVIPESWKTVPEKPGRELGKDHVNATGQLCQGKSYKGQKDYSICNEKEN